MTFRSIILALIVASLSLLFVYNASARPYGGELPTESISSRTSVGGMLLTIPMGIALCVLAIFAAGTAENYFHNRREVNAHIGHLLWRGTWVAGIVIWEMLLKYPLGALRWTIQCLWAIVVRVVLWLRRDAIDCTLAAIYTPVFLFEKMKIYLGENVKVHRRRPRLQ